MLGPLMVGIAGPTLTAEEKAYLQHPAIGGVILFTRNYQSLAQLCALTADIKALREPSLLIAVDQEGGRVQRFREGFTLLPAAGEIHDAEQAEQVGHTMGQELVACGIDISFAPVVDLACADSEVIGSRAFSDDPQTVISLAGAMIKGMHEAGLAAVLKHYPGHGSVVADTHKTVVTDARSWADIEANDWQPFKALASQADGVMASHVVYPQVDDQPAGFSNVWLTKLRQDLGFTGIIFSDDLGMAAAQVDQDPRHIVSKALSAGCDMVLLCNEWSVVKRVLSVS